MGRRDLGGKIDVGGLVNFVGSGTAKLVDDESELRRGRKEEAFKGRDNVRSEPIGYGLLSQGSQQRHQRCQRYIYVIK